MFFCFVSYRVATKEGMRMMKIVCMYGVKDNVVRVYTSRTTTRRGKRTGTGKGKESKTEEGRMCNV